MCCTYDVCRNQRNMCRCTCHRCKDCSSCGRGPTNGVLGLVVATKIAGSMAATVLKSKNGLGKCQESPWLKESFTGPAADKENIADQHDPMFESTRSKKRSGSVSSTMKSDRMTGLECDTLYQSTRSKKVGRSMSVPEEANNDCCLQ